MEFCVHNGSVESARFLDNSQLNLRMPFLSGDGIQSKAFLNGIDIEPTETDESKCCQASSAEAQLGRMFAKIKDGERVDLLGIEM